MIEWLNRGLSAFGFGTGWRSVRSDEPDDPLADAAAYEPVPAPEIALHDLEVGPADPLLSYLEAHPKVTLVEKVPFDSPAVEALRQEAAEVLIPLVANGMLVGVLTLGSRLSGQKYSPADLKTLEKFAMQSAVALRVAQLVGEQEAELQERERIANQLKLAREIQQTLLPQSVPFVPGWEVSAHYTSAWEVGGDFYDFFYCPGNRLGIIIGDVADKGVPAALVMASTRSLLRAASERDPSPASVLTSTNRALVDDIPPHMFVTCFYLLLDPVSGRVCYANAGHDLPYRRSGNELTELRATGMPLGLMPDTTYDEVETVLEPGETIVFYTDGLVEAHRSRDDMFGAARVREVLMRENLVLPLDALLLELEQFTGPGWQQEDDITLVMLRRSEEQVQLNDGRIGGSEEELARFPIVCAPGNEVQAIEQVISAIEPMGLPREKLDRLSTAVGEAVMNGMEHGNQYRDGFPVEVVVSRDTGRLIVRVYDMETEIPDLDAPDPDIDAKLAGDQTPRGWGLFLMRGLVDEFRMLPVDGGKVTELVLYLPDDHFRTK